jgi:hypothetical protein
VRGVLGRVVALQAICRVRRGRSAQVGVATFAGRRRVGDELSCRSVCGGRWIGEMLVERERFKRRGQANPVWAASALRITIVPTARKMRLSAYGRPACSAGGSMTNHQQTHLLTCLCLLPSSCCMNQINC